VAVVDRALAFHKRDRWSSAAAMRDAVRDAHLSVFRRTLSRKSLLLDSSSDALAEARPRELDVATTRRAADARSARLAVSGRAGAMPAPGAHGAGRIPRGTQLSYRAPGDPRRDVGEAPEAAPEEEPATTSQPAVAGPPPTAPARRRTMTALAAFALLALAAGSGIAMRSLSSSASRDPQSGSTGSPQPPAVGVTTTEDSSSEPVPNSPVRNSSPTTAMAASSPPAEDLNQVPSVGSSTATNQGTRQARPPSASPIRSRTPATEVAGSPSPSTKPSASQPRSVYDRW
jgi:hypothetical protein